MLVKKRLHLARAKTNSALRHGGFSRAAACAHSTLRCTASPHGPLRVAYPTFWIPVGLVLTSRALPFVSVRLDSLCTSTSPFPPDTLDCSARAHFLSTQSARCQPLPNYTPQIHEFLSPFFFILLTLLLRLSYLAPIVNPVSSNATSPKAYPPRLLHFRSLYCSLSLRPSIQRTSFHTIPHQ